MGTLTFGQSKGAIKGSVALDNKKEMLTMPVEIRSAPQVLNERTVEKLVYVDRDVIREVIKEVPVNVYNDCIKEVIKEVPIEVIKEVIKIEEKLVNVYKEIPAKLTAKQFFAYAAPLFLTGVALGTLLGYLL